MTISGEKLGAKLYNLRRAGRISLPKAAALYAQGSRHMHNTSWKEDEAFDKGQTVDYQDFEYQEPEDDGEATYSHAHGWGIENQLPEEQAYTAVVTDAEVMGASYENWNALRDQLQVYMASTAMSLTNAGLALEQIANDYAATDAAAAAELREQSKGLDERPEIPEVKHPYSPHDTITVHYDTPDVETPWGDVGLPDGDTEVLKDEPTNPLKGE
ncbi:hypothetical protein [Stackebrandtia nassauensis]|uniref:Uncharacterized protein n=1 Tax=Stackebrandtia nassauensis (strain DSM 44728 / CIP 108903 / NRRL B-16338 / NBRC 102104 / LLR-40K-21) TaxID=446470 RepID=D3Q276_STANL|nr:hypothetical protein [Stackebrandtia nassauensis]ADD43809.1 hypothetical protein Snas_4158 [Stackebrandtia nassauensis DSM 44728]